MKYYNWMDLCLTFLQIKKKLPKVNRTLAARIFEEEEEQNENKGTDDGTVPPKSSDDKKTKKKKGLTSDVFKDERFTAMFENKVTRSIC